MTSWDASPWHWTSSAFDKDAKTGVATVHLRGDDHLPGDQGKEWIECLVEVAWQKDRTEPELRLAALHKLQTLAWREIRALEGFPPDAPE